MEAVVVVVVLVNHLVNFFKNANVDEIEIDWPIPRYAVFLVLAFSVPWHWMVHASLSSLADLIPPIGPCHYPLE